MAKYQKYADYKNVPSAFLKEIPTNWDIKPLYTLCEFKQGKAHEPYVDDDGEYIYVSARFVSTQGASFKQCSVNLTPAKINDVLMVMSDLPNGRALAKAFFVKEMKKYAVNQRVCAITAKRINPKFIYYQLDRSPHLLMNDDGSNQTHLSNNDFMKYPVLVPSKIEQKKIVDFLDHVTAKIDTLIAKQEKLIELLKEKRQAVISNLVAVQNNEPTIKLKYAVEILAGYSFSSAGFQIENDNGIPLLRGINVGVGSIKWDECVWWSKSDTNGLERYLLQEGDLVFGMDRPWISSGARVAEIKQTDLPSYLVQRVARIRCIDGFYQPYVKLVLGSKEFKSFIESDLTGVSVPHISTDQIISFEVRNLTYEQQVFETDKVIGFMFQVEELIDKAQSAIQLMQERRTALISSAVTGKIDVRNWQHPNEAKTEFSA